MCRKAVRNLLPNMKTGQSVASNHNKNNYNWIDVYFAVTEQYPTFILLFWCSSVRFLFKKVQHGRPEKLRTPWNLIHTSRDKTSNSG